VKSLAICWSRACLATALIVPFGTGAQQLTFEPVAPTQLDVIRIRADQLGNGLCPLLDSQNITMEGGTIKVVIDQFAGYCPEFEALRRLPQVSLGRFPQGRYLVRLYMKMLGGEIRPLAEKSIDVLAVPSPSVSGVPVEDFSGVWFDPDFPGDVVHLKQRGEKLIAAVLVHDAAGEPVWYTIPPGTWLRPDADPAWSGIPFVKSTLTKTQGSPFGGIAAPPSSDTIGIANIAFFDLNSIGLYIKLNGQAGAERIMRLQPLRL